MEPTGVTLAQVLEQESFVRGVARAALGVDGDDVAQETLWAAAQARPHVRSLRAWLATVNASPDDAAVLYESEQTPLAWKLVVAPATGLGVVCAVAFVRALIMRASSSECEKQCQWMLWKRSNP